jgi:hypothetical protein
VNSNTAEEVRLAVDDCDSVIKAHEHKEGSRCYVYIVITEVKQLLEKKFQFKLS